MENFCAGLKPHIRLHFLKASPNNKSVAAQIALNVDSALDGLSMLTHRFGGSINSPDRPQPMDIENLKGRTHYRGELFKPRRKIGRETNTRGKRTVKTMRSSCYIEMDAERGNTIVRR